MAPPRMPRRCKVDGMRPSGQAGRKVLLGSQRIAAQCVSADGLQQGFSSNIFGVVAPLRVLTPCRSHQVRSLDSRPARASRTKRAGTDWGWLRSREWSSGLVRKELAATMAREKTCSRRAEDEDFIDHRRHACEPPPLVTAKRRYSKWHARDEDAGHRASWANPTKVGHSD